MSCWFWLAGPGVGWFWWVNMSGMSVEGAGSCAAVAGSVLGKIVKVGEGGGLGRMEQYCRPTGWRSKRLFRGSSTFNCQNFSTMLHESSGPIHLQDTEYHVGSRAAIPT